MILVDTSVWIDHLRANDQKLAQLLIQDIVLMHPYVRSELSLGNMQQREVILSLLDNLAQAPVAYADEINFFIEKHALYGLGIGLIDVHLLVATQLSEKTTLWTRDKRLLAVAQRLNLATTFDNAPH